MTSPAPDLLPTISFPSSLFADGLLKRKETARVLRTSESTIDRLARNGLLHPLRVGRLVRFRASDVARLIEVDEPLRPLTHSDQIGATPQV
jgi:excisionase family DNA binding protein